MASKIFTELLTEKIKIFTNAFESTSRNVFYDDATARLLHTGEFGTYREQIARDFLKNIVPGRLEINTGFVITAQDSISTQCDIVIYDALNTPLIESVDKQRFFPVETVCGIGEVKSVLSKMQLKEALNKLAKIKKLKEEITSPTIIKREREGVFSPKDFAYDQLPSFLICESFDFNFSDLQNELSGMYEDDILHRHKHNLILSIKDGIALYVANDGMDMMVPEIQGRNSPSGLTPLDVCTNRFISYEGESIEHIFNFSTYLFMLTSSATILYPEVTNYLNISNGNVSDENVT